MGDLIFSRPFSILASYSPTNLIGLFFVGVFVNQSHPRAELDRAGHLFRVDHVSKGNRTLKLFDAAFDERLLFLGRVVFCVFGQIAVLAGFGDGLMMVGRSTDFRCFSSGFPKPCDRRGSWGFFSIGGVHAMRVTARELMSEGATDLN